MKQNRLLLFAFVLSILTPGFLFAQGWDRLYDVAGFDYGAALTQTTDGGYAILGGNGNSAPYYVQNVSLLRTDADGELLWQYEYSSDTLQLGTDIIQTSDLGFVFVGTQISDQPLPTIFIQKVNADGTLAWNKTFENLGSFQQGNSVTPTADGGFIVVGSDNSDFVFIKTDGEGEELSRAAINYGAFDSATKIKPAANGDFLVFGYTFEYTVITRITPDLEVVWQELQLFSDANDILETSGGQVVLVGTQQLTILNSDGSTFDIVPLNLDFFSVREPQLLETGPDSYAYVAYGSSSDQNLDQNVYLTFLNINGQINSTHQLTATINPSKESLTDVIACPNGGFVVLADFLDEGTAQDFHLIKTAADGTVFTNELCGIAFYDQDTDCLLGASENGLWQGWMVTATNATQSFYSITDENGDFCMTAGTGTYEIELHPPYNTWTSCPNQSITFDGTYENQNIEIGAQTDYNCPLTTVSTTSSAFRPCMESYLYFEYCNEGGQPAEDAYILVTLDPFIELLSASISYTEVEPGIYQFDVGTLMPGDCGYIQATAFILCDAELGQSLCYEAQIFPFENCFDDWMDGILEVEATCEDGTIQFSINNVSDFPMSEQTEYYVIEDNIILMSDPDLNLPAGGMMPISVPVENGATYRLEAAQIPGFPAILGGPFASATVEGCDGTNPGFVNIFPPDDGEPYLDINCVTVTGSYDPNDKRAIPEGYGDAHNIRPGVDLEYIIRFQNTGTDTAFLVVIRDTISEFLDLTTLKAGAASHDYKLEVLESGVLKFTFENILLPDSTTNEPASHGIVQYTIAQKPDLPLGTEIFNSAAIYFDFNEPVITNQTWHTINEDFIIVDLEEIESNGIELTIAPNPFREHTFIELDGLEVTNGQIQLFSTSGQLVREKSFAGNRIELLAEDLPRGIYLFRIASDNQLLATGRLSVQ